MTKELQFIILAILGLFVLAGLINRIKVLERDNYELRMANESLKGIYWDKNIPMRGGM